MLKSITTYISAIKRYIDDALKDYHGLAYHTGSDPESGENTSVPEVFEYTMPSTRLVDGYPDKAPCIVIAIDSHSEDDQGRDSWSITLHLCVCYASIANNEKVQMDETGKYKYIETGGYDTESSVELLKTSIIFTEQIAGLIRNFKEISHRNMNIEIPSSDVPDFPYAISRISFDIDVNPARIGQNPYHQYY